MLRPQILILGYHRVLPEVDARFGIPDLMVSAADFRAQLKFWKQDREFISFRDLESVGPKDRVAILTFDDGYRDNYEVAAPILEEYNATATFFVTTGFIDGTDNPWWEWTYREFTAIGSHLDNTWARYREKLIAKPPKTEKTSGVEFMTWDMLRGLASSGHLIQAHTVSHPSLGHLSELESEQEIIESTRQVEDETGHDPLVFAYPYGQLEHYSGRESILQRLGYKFAVTTRHTPNRPYELPRVMVGQRDTLWRLRLKLIRQKLSA
jgi:peptidoglycan/xylan/chitin deacetylase (PgdA/CDA1 family)